MKRMIASTIGFVVLIGVAIAFYPGSEEERPKYSPEVEESLAQWMEILPELLRIAPAEEMVPLWNAEGTTLELINSRKEAVDLEAKAEELASVLKEKTTLVRGPLIVTFNERPEGEKGYDSLEEVQRVYFAAP